jgi:glycosyltransferase involved in cell wall biosynthesis
VNGRGFSVVICTFNGAARIERVLMALAELKDGTAHEIIVVDNGSTDGVAAVASAIWTRIGRQPVDFRVIAEPIPGLSAARRAGARAATRELVVFCDDDNLLAPDYLEVAASLMADETIGAAGGANTPIADYEIPPLFFSLAHLSAVGAQALANGEIDQLWGAGLVVRRKLLAQLYDTPGFPLLVGRRGSALTCGEDLEICLCVCLLGYRLWYDESLYLRHIVPSERVNAAYIRGLTEGFKAAHPVLSRYAELRDMTNQTFRQRIRSILSAAARIPVFVRRRDARSFGLMARFGMTFLMTGEERAILRISRSLQKSRQTLSPAARGRIPLSS